MSTVAIEVGGAAPHCVTIGAGALDGVRSLAEGRSAMVVTDPHVRRLHAGRLGLDAPVLEVERGEAAKRFATLERVLEGLAGAGLDRHSLVIALGGGSIGDLAGLAASLYMRGIAVVQCPTTLLAQVDASVGGKTAIDLAAGKNLAGTFHAPSAVFADTTTLATLDAAEFACGLGEVVKSALLEGEEFLAWLEARSAAVARRDADVVAELVVRSVRLKAGVVARDPRESGERKALNLGHTFAHAIEHVAGFGRVPHGVAVGVGLVLALRAGGNGELASRTERLLAALGLATSLDALRRRYGAALEPSELVRSMQLDKKGLARTPRFVLLDEPGRARWDQPLAREVVERVLA
jgi:3-dehydroquinate synthase